MSKCYRSQLVGVFGCPIDENPTGVVEEAAFHQLGLDYRYITMLVKPGALEDAIRGMKAVNMRGVNLTIPHKVAVIPYLDELSEAAEIIGAVNVIVNRGGKLWGENTDGKGFLAALQKEGVPVAGKNVTILGAGGAARAISVECALAGCKSVCIINRSSQRGRDLAELISRRTPCVAEFRPWTGSAAIPAGTDILVNATCLGLYPNVTEKPDIQYDSIPAGAVMTDVVFNDPNTLFLAEGKARGIKTINGLGMLAQQAARNFTLWTEKEAPVAVMEQALRKEFCLTD